nr:hypothetical protein [Tanacetum cinerariifolium]
MAYFVAILTPDSAWSCVMQCTIPTKGMRSIISMVSISLKGSLPSILLLVVIIVAVVIIAVILVVVVIDAIVGVVIVVSSIRVVVVIMIIGIVVIFDGGISHIIKLSFVIIVTFPSMIWGSPPMKASIIFSVFGTMFGHKMANSWNLLTLGNPIVLFYSDRLSVCIPPRQGIIGQVFLLGLSAFAMAAACTSKAAATPFVISFWMVASVIVSVADKEFKTSRDRHENNRMIDLIRGLDTKIHQSVVDLTGDEDPSDKDKGTRMGDSTGVSVSLGEISLEENKSWESNIGESDNTGDGGRLAGKITVVILVRDRCPRGKGNLPRLSIISNIVHLDTDEWVYKWELSPPIDLFTILVFTRKQLMAHDMEIMALEAT